MSVGAAFGAPAQLHRVTPDSSRPPAPGIRCPGSRSAVSIVCFPVLLQNGCALFLFPLGLDFTRQGLGLWNFEFHVVNQKRGNCKLKCVFNWSGGDASSELCPSSASFAHLPLRPLFLCHCGEPALLPSSADTVPPLAKVVPGS